MVGLVSSMLIFGFNNGKNDSIIESMKKQFDYGVCSINKENKITSTDSPITLIQTMRPNKEEINEIAYTCDEFHICYSYDALISSVPEISFIFNKSDEKAEPKLNNILLEGIGASSLLSIII